VSDDNEHQDHEHGPSGSGLKATFGKRIGPLPMGVWLLAVAGGIGVAYVIRRRTAAAAPTDAVTGADLGTGLDNTVVGGGAAPGSGSTNVDPTAGTGGPLQTNDDWYRRCMTVLVAKGYDASAVDTALRKYLDGQALTPTEAAIKALALTYVGPPPIPPPPPAPGEVSDPIPTPSPIPIPQPGPPTPKPTVTHKYPEWHYSYTNLPGDDYSKIASKLQLGISGDELFAYQFTAQAGRPAATLAAMRARKPPTKIFAGGETEIPYPK
jgi:hypothetical protein